MRVERSTRVVAAIVAIGLCALAPGSPSAGAAAATVTLTASCAFPSADPATPADPVAVPADIATELPDTATTAAPVALNAFSVGVTIPEATVAALRTAGTTSIGAGFTVALTGTWQQQPHDIAVPAMTSPDNPLPDTGDLRITATADIAPIPVDAAGDVTFAVPQVITTLTLHNGGTAVDAPCTEDPGQDGTLGTVPVTGPTSDTPTTTTTAPPSSTSGTSTTTGPSGSSKPSSPGGKLADGPTGPAPGDLPDDFDGICDIKAPGSLPVQPARYKIGGKITVKKLGSDLTVPFGELRGDMYLHLAPPSYACIDATATVPDAPGYFTMFNFAPATADVHVAPAHTRAKIGAGYLTSLTKAPTSMHNATVNGTPLDVGPDCRTSGDVTIKLAGPFQTFTSSGTVPGVVNMPAFTGCHNGSDPSTPIFTGLVSGPDNPALMDLIYICYSVACNGKP